VALFSLPSFQHLHSLSASTPAPPFPSPTPFAHTRAHRVTETHATNPTTTLAPICLGRPVHSRHATLTLALVVLSSPSLAPSPAAFVLSLSLSLSLSLHRPHSSVEFLSISTTHLLRPFSTQCVLCVWALFVWQGGRRPAPASSSPSLSLSLYPHPPPTKFTLLSRADRPPP